MYGIKNCDTIKKARRWLEAIRLSIASTITVPMALIANCCIPLSPNWAEALLNTRGTTWRKLDETVRAGSINNADAAGLMMLEMPAIIKRPLLCAPGQPMLLGFSEPVIRLLTRCSLCLARSLS
jgi:Spx/MgsR family transcriptional regulator